MVDYPKVMRLLLEGRSYRQIGALLSVAPATVSKAAKAVEKLGVDSPEQLDMIPADRIAAVVADGRRRVVSEFAPIDFDAVLRARTGRKKIALNVLWMNYVDSVAACGLKPYSYERFRQLVANEVGMRGLTARIEHSPGRTMQVDWSGTKIPVVNPVTGGRWAASIFVASLPYSGMIFATARRDQTQHSWHEAHRLAFEYFDGVAEVIVPDNATTASVKVTRQRWVRRINPQYEAFLAHYATAALAAPPAKPQHKGGVEAGVQVVKNWVIGRLSGRTFHMLDDLNEAIAEKVEWVNNRTPFRDQNMSRRQLFSVYEHDFLGELPSAPYTETVWKKAKVAPDWHITVSTVHYSVPFVHVGKTVDVRISDHTVDIFTDGQCIATHPLTMIRGRYVTNTNHCPPGMEIPNNLWTKQYFLTQAFRVGPATRKAISNLFDHTPITAQGYQPARNILSLGKGEDNKVILEKACAKLTAGNTKKKVTYHAVKTMMASIRANATHRPQNPAFTRRDINPARPTQGAHTKQPTPRTPQPTNRGGFIGGIDQFTLAHITSATSNDAPKGNK